MFPIADSDNVLFNISDGIFYLMPKYEDIPKEFKHRTNNFHKLATKWFFCGLDNEKFISKAGVDSDKAINHLFLILDSMHPQHNHKMAAVAFLMSEWFEDIH